MKNKDIQQLASLQQQVAHLEKKKTKKKSGNGFRVVVAIALFACAGYFLTGCSYHPECDQTVHGRGNIPASCRGVTYGGSK